MEKKLGLGTGNGQLKWVTGDPSIPEPRDFRDPSIKDSGEMKIVICIRRDVCEPRVCLKSNDDKSWKNLLHLVVSSLGCDWWFLRQFLVLFLVMQVGFV